MHDHWGPRVSNYRRGEMRFGNVPSEGAGEVITTHWTPEQIKEHFGGDSMNKPELAEAKKLLAETNLSIAEIAEKTGANKLSVRTYASKIRGKGGKVEKTLNNISRTEELQKQLAEQKRRTAQFEAGEKHWKKQHDQVNELYKSNRESHAKTLELLTVKGEEYRKLEQEHNQLNYEYDKLKEHNQKMLVKLQSIGTQPTGYEEKYNRLIGALETIVPDENVLRVVKALI
jgi:chromosome segregation ATPase